MILFHASPLAERAAILDDGLQPADPGCAGPVGVYLFADLANAAFFAAVREKFERDEYGPDASPYEVWRVDTAGLDLYPDPLVTDRDPILAEYPIQPVTSVYTTNIIDPSRISQA
jgi:hypothetical protein